MTGKPTAGALRQRRFRAQHRRIDYAPQPDVIEILQRHCAAGNRYITWVIDELIRAADKAISGNESVKGEIKEGAKRRAGEMLTENIEGTVENA